MFARTDSAAQVWDHLPFRHCKKFQINAFENQAFTSSSPHPHVVNNIL